MRRSSGDPVSDPATHTSRTAPHTCAQVFRKPPFPILPRTPHNTSSFRISLIRYRTCTAVKSLLLDCTTPHRTTTHHTRPGVQELHNPILAAHCSRPATMVDYPPHTTARQRAHDTRKPQRNAKAPTTSKGPKDTQRPRRSAKAPKTRAGTHKTPPRSSQTETSGCPSCLRRRPPLGRPTLCPDDLKWRFHRPTFPLQCRP